MSQHQQACDIKNGSQRQNVSKLDMKTLSSVKQIELVPGVGLEPTRITPADFKSAASAYSATPALTEAILPLLVTTFN